MTLIKQMFSSAEIIAAVNKHNGSVTKAARHLTDYGRGPITHQQVRYWVSTQDSSDTSDGFDRAKELAKSRNAQTENAKLRRDVRALADAVGPRQSFLDSVAEMALRLPERPPVDYRGFMGGQVGTPMTVEILLSDLQIGKLSPGYNTLVARKRLFEFGRAALFQIEQKASVGYRVERIVLGLLGDIIESDKKHKNSARATDTGTAEQIADAITGLFEFVIEPLARLGIPMEVIGITGNHDWDDHGLNMFQPGKQQLSWPLYKALEMITDRSGYSNVTWVIPEGSYAITQFYGQYCLYEHGVGVSVAEASMKAHKVRRAEQEQRHLTYFRMGDKHTVTSFNSGQMVVNGAFFGAMPGGTEYSGIAGYSSVAAQWMGFHVERRDPRMMTIYDSFVIQLGHVSE